VLVIDYQVRSTLLTSHLPVNKWHAQIRDPMVADAILVHLMHNADLGAPQKLTTSTRIEFKTAYSGRMPITIPTRCRWENVDSRNDYRHRFGTGKRVHVSKREIDSEKQPRWTAYGPTTMPTAATIYCSNRKRGTGSN
jgi:hypothetical protein